MDYKHFYPNIYGILAFRGNFQVKTTKTNVRFYKLPLNVYFRSTFQPFSVCTAFSFLVILS